MESCSDLLTNDHSGQGLKSLQEEIFGMKATLKANMDKGISVEEANQANELKNAIEVAQSLLDSLYKSSNA